MQKSKGKNYEVKSWWPNRTRRCVGGNVRGAAEKGREEMMQRGGATSFNKDLEFLIFFQSLDL